ncbi:hypothetical protein IB265_24820 [Ensifer sp. ENS10]|uniref:hypothetical protein n=1 Tax=Ensifer sp. ENS10 TaxID=2769286 RepID=UPI00177B4C48|nr:hypothetical protein [Ensifer sp. ENS10]MBD9510002.1 hypothetical protein [Ensifer sp. ENS10]
MIDLNPVSVSKDYVTKLGGTNLYLDHALEEALRDLVALHGHEYLDKFQSRIAETLTKHLRGDGLPVDASASVRSLIVSESAPFIEFGETAITNVVSRVRG